MFTEKEDFLNNNECDYLIDLFYEYKSVASLHRDTSVLEFDYIIFNCKDERVKDTLKNIRSKVEHYIKQLDYSAFVNYLQVVEWPSRSFQNLHYDFEFHCYTSIIYLNHDYEGGYTQVGDSIITPKKGKIITFNGNDILHGVLPVTKGYRYTVPVWYKSYK